MPLYFKKDQGFTLTELIVSLGIFFVILTVVIRSQGSYTNEASLAQLVDKIRATIFQAQAYSIGVKEFTPGSGNFSISHGVVFNSSSLIYRSFYINFTDQNSNGIYDGDLTCTGNPPECLEKVDLPLGTTIETLCIVRTVGLDICGTGRAEISFVRPNLEARIRIFLPDGSEYLNPAMSGVRVTFINYYGTTRSIIIYKTGQVSVEQ